LYNLNSNINKNGLSFIDNSYENKEKQIIDNKLIYQFNNNENYINLIDFNQSLLYGYDYQMKFKNSPSKITKDILDIEHLNIISTLYNIFPEYVIENKELLLKKLVDKKYYDFVFTRLMTYDVYKITNILLNYIDDKKFNIEIQTLLLKIKDHSFNILSEILTYKENSNIVDKYLPNYIFLTKYFNEFQYNQQDNKKSIIKDIIVISNIFNIDNIQNKEDNIPSLQYDFYINILLQSADINAKLLKINGQFFKNKSDRIVDINKLYNLGNKTNIQFEPIISQLKKILDNDLINMFKWPDKLQRELAEYKEPKVKQ
jgi:hypothetical protein